VTHLGVFHGDAAVGCHTLADTRPSVRPYL